jgi:acetyl esterase/lipase
VIYIHGGAWISGDKESYQKLGQLFVGHGLAMAVVNYRLAVAPAPARFPEPARDVAAALTLLKKEASSLGFDGGKVFLIGHSAGAHIAATLALAPEFDSVSPQVSGYIGIEGIYDIPALVRRWPTYRDWFIDLAFGSNPGLWKQASPQYWRGKTVRPWLLIHSTKDELVDMGQSEGFFHHLHRLKVPATLDKSSQQSHFGVIEALGKPGDPILKKILAFIDEH